jgi:acetylglutamate kinase
MHDDATGETTLVDFGHVGDVEAVDVGLPTLLVENGYVPVISSLAGDPDGSPLNVNADTVASVLACGMGASKLITLTGVPGLLRDLADPSSVISRLTIEEARAMMGSGAVAGGMIPKLKTLIEALEGGVGQAVILSGVEESALLLELFTDEGVGTLIEPHGASGRSREPRG